MFISGVLKSPLPHTLDFAFPVHQYNVQMTGIAFRVQKYKAQMTVFPFWVRFVKALNMRLRVVFAIKKLKLPQNILLCPKVALSHTNC